MIHSSDMETATTTVTATSDININSGHSKDKQTIELERKIDSITTGADLFEADLTDANFDTLSLENILFSCQSLLDANLT